MINENGLLNIFPTAEASGSIVSFENGADGIPMESLSVAIEPIQDLHGYDHPWPAGGGVNKLDISTSRVASEGTITQGGVTATYNSDGSIRLQASASQRVDINIFQNATYPLIVPAGTYTFSISGNAGYEQYIHLCASGSGDAYNGARYFDVATSATITVVDGAKPWNYVLLRIFAGGSFDVTVKIQLELGSTATEWTPYANICPISGRTGLSVYVGPTTAQADATTYAVDWTSEAGTVYGGTDEVVGGNLESTYGMVDLGTLNWGKYSVAQGTLFRTTINDSVDQTSTVKSNALCSAYPTVAQANRAEGTLSANGHSFDIIDSRYTNAADFKAAMSGVQLCYELATPITYQLTPQEVTTLLGANRVWSDAGDISLVYHTQADATPSSIDGLFINGEGLQADGWFLKWRKLAAPKPKTDYVSVWGRDGDIDLTESETDGQVFYENRELTMDMVYMGEDWTDAYSELLDMLHGKECAVQFSNDPYWYWAGRIIASLYEHKPHSLTMSGIMFPYKLSVAKVTRSATVSGAIESNGVEVVLPSSRMRVSPKVTVVAGTGESVTLKWGTKTQTLSAGTYYVRGLKVGSDDVTIKVWGTGTVTFEYRKGML